MIRDSPIEREIPVASLPIPPRHSRPGTCILGERGIPTQELATMG